jgi:hypothetical protein
MTTTSGRRRWFPVVLTVVVCTSALAGGFAVAEPGGGSPPATAAQDPVVEQQGDVVAVELDVPTYDGGSVDITGEDADYSASLSVKDGNGDGTVTLLFNTYRPGAGGTFSTANDDDTASYYSQTRLEGLLPVGDYVLSVSTSDGESYERVITVEPRETGGVALFAAPDGTRASVDAVDDLERLRSSGVLTPLGTGDGPSEVAVGDTVVLRVNASGLSGAVDRQSGSSFTEQFVNFAEDGPAALEFVEQDPDATPTQGTVFWNATNTQVVATDDGDTYYVVLDTEDLTLSRDPDEDEDLGPVTTGMTLQANFTLVADAYGSEGTTSSTPFTIEERSASPATDSGFQEAGGTFLSPSLSQRLTWQTTLAPGSEVAVRVLNDSGGVMRRAAARVQSDGTATATVDLSAVEDGRQVGVSVVDADGRELGRVQGVVDEPSATVDVADQSVDDGSLAVDVATDLSRGGVVVLQAADGEVVDAASVEPGEQTVTLAADPAPSEGDELVAVAYRDLDGDGALSPETDEPYERGGSAVTATATVSVTPTPTPSAPPTETTPTTAPATGNDTPTSGGTATEGTASPAGGTTSPTDDGPIPTEVPGFGPVAAAVALALVALRRMW